MNAFVIAFGFLVGGILTLCLYQRSEREKDSHKNYVILREAEVKLQLYEQIGNDLCANIKTSGLSDKQKLEVLLHFFFTVYPTTSIKEEIVNVYKEILKEARESLKKHRKERTYHPPLLAN